MRSNKQLYDLGIETDCFRALDQIEKSKVTRRRQGTVTMQPRSNYGRVMWELGYRAWLDEQPVPEPSPEPTPPPTQPWDSGYAPQAYNQGSRGQDARYNIRINCTQSGSEYIDGKGIHYADDGLCKGGRTGNPVSGLKPSDMMDGKEPWEAYEWLGRTIGPDKEDYPPESYSV